MTKAGRSRERPAFFVRQPEGMAGQAPLLAQRGVEGVIAGKMSKEIAADLGTALKTVKVQRGRVMEKMGVVSVAELVQWAPRVGNLLGS